MVVLKPEETMGMRNLKFIAAFRSLEEVIIVEEDGKIKLLAMVEDPAIDGAEERMIIDKIEFTHKVKINR